MNNQSQQFSNSPSTSSVLYKLSALPLLAQTDIRPTRGIIEPSFWAQNWIWITIVTVIALIVAFVAFFINKRKKNKPEIVLSPYELALKDLVTARDYMEQKRDKAFSSSISNAVRYYIERSYRVAAPEQTTEEFLAEAANHPQLKGKTLDLLSHFLQLCDIAKFAQQTFGDAQREEQYESAKNFIEASHRSLSVKNPATSASKAPIAPEQKGDASLQTS